jgi:hypothetical protein
VGASLVGDIARFSKIDYDEDFARILTTEPAADGEALGFNVKVGRTLGERWGVEFEFARTGTFEDRASVILPAVIERLDLRIPPVEFGYEVERTHLMLGALAFVHQDLGDRVELSYLGGVMFNRVESDQDFDEGDFRIQIFPPAVYPDFETIEYGVGPAAGIEAAIKFGSAALTTGVRLQSAGIGRGGWMIRPNVGMRYTF